MRHDLVGWPAHGRGVLLVVRIGGAPVAAKGPARPRIVSTDPADPTTGTSGEMSLPPNAKEATEKFIQEHARWIDNPRSDEERAKALNNRANAFFSYRRFDLAIKDREAERALTGKVFCGRCLAQAYLANGQHDRAIEEFKSISVARPEQERDLLAISAWPTIRRENMSGPSRPTTKQLWLKMMA